MLSACHGFKKLLGCSKPEEKAHGVFIMPKSDLTESGMYIFSFYTTKAPLKGGLKATINAIIKIAKHKYGPKILSEFQASELLSQEVLTAFIPGFTNNSEDFMKDWAPLLQFCLIMQFMVNKSNYARPVEDWIAKATPEEIK